VNVVNVVNIPEGNLPGLRIQRQTAGPHFLGDSLHEGEESPTGRISHSTISRR